MIPSTKSRTAFITGASSGIGEAYARRLASDGYNVVVCARSEAKLSKLARDLTARHDVQATVLALDLCQPSQLAEAISHIEAISTPDILVHSAGVGIERSNISVRGSADARSSNQTEREQQGKNGCASHRLRPFDWGVHSDAGVATLSGHVVVMRRLRVMPVSSYSRM